MESNVVIKNLKLLNKIASLQIKYNKDNERSFYNELTKSEFLLPSIVVEKDKIKIVKISDNNGNEYIPAYTDWENFSLNEHKEEKIQVVIFTVHDYIKIIQKDLTIAGMVINPYSTNLVLKRENLNYIKIEEKTIKKNENISIGIPTTYPQKLVDNCILFLKKENTVQQAFLLQMVRETYQKSLVLVIDEKDDLSVFSRLSKYAQKFLERDEILDIVSLNSDFGRQITEQYTPFYEKLD